jgi:hypothetical protein
MSNKLRISGAVLLLLSLTACSKLNLQNYEQIEMGMEMSDVEGLIGKADECSELLGTQSCYWGDKESVYIKVSFVTGMAVTYSQDGLE